MSSSQIPSGDQEQLEDSPEENEKSVESVVVEQIEDEAIEEEEDLCDTSHLLIKNTESFKCLAQVILSNSSLLRHPLYYFPPLEDPGIDDVFNYKSARSYTNKRSSRIYRKYVRKKKSSHSKDVSPERHHRLDQREELVMYTYREAMKDMKNDENDFYSL
ncbi:hypothetical protein NQ318_008363 [Aromia moschata]|uniref:Uncharacterized protein n=1 Tax=Aromia moschata TaxID=1265417 RepID=A0AAV8YJT1_9CUCU|nr:hypothetical protein NQ318_008363 [Aromia moschata]